MPMKLLTFSFVILLAGGCAAPASQNAGATAAVEAKKTRFGTWGVDLAVRDAATKPGDDFNRYANGKWLDSFVIPADLSNYGTFTELRLKAERDIRAIVEELAAKKAAAGSLEQKVGDFYQAWMDTERLEQLGAAPLKSHIDGIAAIKDKKGLMRAFATQHHAAPFGVGIIPDPADTSRYVAVVGQGGLGMPNRKYYLKKDDRFVQYRAEYEKFIARMLTLAGVAEGEAAAAKADKIMALEMALAESHWTPEDSRDIQKIYNPMDPKKLAALSPQLDWKLIFENLGLANVPTFVVLQTSAIDASGDIFEKTPLALWKDYLAFHFVRNHAAYLSKAFDQAHFDFYSQTLNGIEEQRERWKRGVQQVNQALGDAVGQIYVDRHFPPAHKAKMEALVSNLTEAFKERLLDNEWMDEETRKQALVKLSTFEPRIGYASKWTDYKPLSIKAGALLDNAMALADFQWQEQVERFKGPVDRQRWGYPPQTVNASYNPLLNQITFPAGILQPPFFDPEADAAVNYGAIGAVIGHEIGHGFDDQGRRFDEKGRIRDWWTKAADERFAKRTTNLGGQYGMFSPIEGMNISGELTMGENIGDLGGMQMAYAAYHRHLAQCCSGQAAVVDGLSGDQRFFLGWAQVWRGKMRDDALRQRLVSDPHSPPEFRINGVVRNMDAWYQAFGITADAKLYLPPEKRVRIW